MVVVPLAYEAGAQPRAPRVPGAPLRVLWLGNVTLRRGIPYLLEAARLLESTDIRFTIAGTLYIREGKAASAPSNVEFLGRVPRAETAALYAQCDLFVLPTISDGFALTQLEAMAHGLPVIATTHCGRVVTPGVDGEIVPICDGATLAETILEFDKNRDRLHAMSEAALEKSRQYSLETLASNLENSLGAL
jgi:glycosyltransferase involved in cell wall biosynthesis